MSSATRVASIPSDSPISKGFVSKERFAALGPEERARVQLATHDFDAGLDTLERLFASGEVQPQQLGGALTNYLVISIRVKRDCERPAATLRTFAERPDLPASLRLDAQRWTEALGSIPATEARKARAYYLLGLAELRIGRSYWLALPDFHLETAIPDPGGDAVRQAYALIEEQTFYTYSLGVSPGGVVGKRKVPELPLDVEQRLAG